MKIDWNNILLPVIFFIIGWLLVPSPFHKEPIPQIITIRDTIKIPIPPIKGEVKKRIPLKVPTLISNDSISLAINATPSGDSLDLSFAWNIQPKPIEFPRDTTLNMLPIECPPTPFYFKPEFAYPTGVAIGIIISYIIYSKYEK